MRGLIDLLRARKAGVLGINRRNLDYVLSRNPRAAFPLADDKLMAKEVMAGADIPHAPTITTFSAFHELEDVRERLAGLDHLVVKPARGRQGRGILVLHARGEDGFTTPSGRVVRWDAMRRHVADIVFGIYTLDRPDVAVVEPRLFPDAFFGAFWPHGLSDVRLILVDEVPTLAMARVPTEASDGKANLHQGAVGLGIDLESGRVHRAWWHGAEVSEHPDSGAPLLGLQVPEWAAVRDIGSRLARAVPLKFLGIDVAFDRDRGPLVLEFNARPGLEIQNVTGQPLRDRLRALGVDGGAA